MRTVLQLRFDQDTTSYLEYAAAIKGTTVEKFVAGLCDRNFLRETIEESALDVIGDYERLNKLPRSTGSDKAGESELNQCWQNMIANRAALGV